jgi:hypothetical protein
MNSQKLTLTMPQIDDAPIDDELFENNDFGSQINEHFDHDLLEILNDQFNLD